MIAIEVEEPVTNTIETTALATAEQARSITVTNSTDHIQACDKLRGIQSLIKEVETFFSPMKKKAHDSWKEIVAKEKSVLDPLSEAKAHLSRQIGGYEAAEETKRRAEENRLRLEAQRVAEDRARQEAEEIKLQRAIEAEQNGDKAGAEAVLSAPIEVAPAYVAPIIVPKTVVKQSGIATRRNWKFRVANSALVPREYLAVDEQKIGQVVRALKENCAIPGIEVYAEDAVAVRT